MNTIRAVIFDKDGTLFPYSLWAGPLRRCLEENLPVRNRRNRDEIVSAFLSVLSIDERGNIGPESALFSRKKRPGAVVKLFLLTLRYRLNPAKAAAGFLSIRSRYRYGFRKELEEYGMEEEKATLMRLRKDGLILALFSSDSPFSVKVAEDVLFPFAFDYRVDSSSPVRKPDPDTVRIFAAEYNISSNETAFVSDTPEDLLMAGKAGCRKVIAVEGSFTRKELEKYTDCVISHFSELPDILFTASEKE